MPSPINPDDNHYASSQDSDFAPDEVAAQASESSDSDEEGGKPRHGAKRQRSEADEGYNNSGDEAVIQKGRKRQRRARDKGEVQGNDGGEGGLIKTRRQRAEEKAERQLAASTGPVTIDVDALWEQMKSGKPISTSIKPDEPGGRSGNGPDEPGGGEDDATLKIAGQSADDPSETMLIKRTYNFAGRIHTEDKIVARDSAEARLYLATQGKENEGDAADTSPARRATRKAFRSSFEPVLDAAAAGPGRTDLNLGLAARRLAAQEAQAKKLNTVEKSRMDWAGYVDREGIQDELALASKSKDSYNARQAFLARSEAIRDGEEKRARMATRA
ncbi:hypothetical protein XA68_12965 [Ophiocordyceps unilateralis]|uniref:SWR1-complex protein 5 n=1 Tax=Ophiocordyceps unilateralis TaxID=268505 RepID=A0A2A9PCF6_OPHUN|nr:hypothetical protein XA68_12965 [Ophiocordyceps unilateralis]